MNRKYILIAEDDKLLLQTLSELLEEAGFHIYSATSGQSALKLFEKNSSHISWILTDLEMPFGDGAWLAEKIKQIEPQAIIVLFTSASTNKIQKINCDLFFKILQKPQPSEVILTLALKLDKNL